MKTNEERVRDLLGYLGSLSHVKPEEIPDIDLYMDQVTTFMESHLKDMRRHPEDKVLTKTMINNYAKNNLLPPPVKKKYSKSLLSFNDIEELFRPITSRHFTGKDSPLSLEDIYTEVFTLEKGEMGSLMKDVTGKFARSRKTFQDVSVDEEDKEYLQLFAFICELSFDVYLKTQMIEMIADQLRGEATPPRKK